MKRIVNSIIRLFSPIAEVILLEGSYAWNGNKVGSDMDIEIVVKSFAHLERNLFKIRESSLLNAIKNCLLEVNCDTTHKIIQTKIAIERVMISVRILEFDTFKVATHVNLTNLEESLYFTSVRDSVRLGQSEFYFQRNFNGFIMPFRKKWKVKGDKQITWVPVALLDSFGRFYPGSILDRYISSPKILYDKSGTAQDFFGFLNECILSRFLYEKEQNILAKDAKAYKCLSHWDQLPNNIQKEILTKMAGHLYDD